jgi:hypothetical protein
VRRGIVIVGDRGGAFVEVTSGPRVGGGMTLFVRSWKNAIALRHGTVVEFNIRPDLSTRAGVAAFDVAEIGRWS